MKDGLREICIRRLRASSIPAPSIQTGSSFGLATARFRSGAMRPEKRTPAPPLVWEISQTPRSAQVFRQPSRQRLLSLEYPPAVFRSAPFLAIARRCARGAARGPDTHRWAQSQSSPVENIPAPAAFRCAPPTAPGCDNHMAPRNAPQSRHPTRRRPAVKEFPAKSLSSASTAPPRGCAGNGSLRISENERTSPFRVLPRVRKLPAIPPKLIFSFSISRSPALLHRAKHKARKRYFHRRAPNRYHHI